MDPVAFLDSGRAKISLPQCLGQNYAHNEASLFMIRLLQRFESFTLAEDKQLSPPWKTNPPPTDPSKRGMFGPCWPGTKRKALEKIWPSHNIVLSVKVCCVAISFGVLRYFVPREDCGFESRRLSEVYPQTQQAIRYITRHLVWRTM